MELNTINQPLRERIDLTLGIPPHRLEYLGNIVLQYAEAISKKPYTPQLSEYYKVFAEASNNIEEYTLCMHVFIFRLCKSGYLASDASAQN